MKYTIRMKEDWVLLLTNLLLFGVSIAAAGQGFVFLALLFFAVECMVVFILLKKMRARWCVDCQLPMQAMPPQKINYERLRYVCGSCGKTNDSGIQIRWPE